MKRKEHNLIQHFIEDFVAGAISSSISKTATAPLERIKLMLQMYKVEATTIKISPMKNILRILSHQGFLSLWRGNIANLLRYFPSQALILASKDTYKVLFDNYLSSKNESIMKKLTFHFLASSLGGATSLIGSYPFDMIRTKIAIETSPNSIYYHFRESYIAGSTQVSYSNYPLRVVYGISSVYKGFVLALFGVMLYKGLHIGGYDFAKEQMLIYYSKHDNLDKRRVNWKDKFLFAWIWSSLTGTFCYPLDTWRRRYMLQSRDINGELLYRNSIDCFWKIFQSEGILVFYRGAGVNIIRGGGGAIVLVGYDLLQESFRTHKDI